MPTPIPAREVIYPGATVRVTCWVKPGDPWGFVKIDCRDLTHALTCIERDRANQGIGLAGTTARDYIYVIRDIATGSLLGAQ